MKVCASCGHRGEEDFCPRDWTPMVDAQPCDPPQDASPFVGRVFGGKYEVKELLGSGGMGTVWRALDLVMQRPVALKLLRHDPRADVKAARRFVKEARACSRLTHPNTVRVLDFGAAEDSQLYMVMELLEGRDLATVLKDERSLHPRRAVDIARQIVKSLDEAHCADVVHRDLKPSNVFLALVHGEGDFVKVIDFGLAKAVDPVDWETLTVPGCVLGTAAYISPEQVKSEEVDARADLYSLGIILFEMLSGRRPFHGETRETEMLARMIDSPPPPPEETQGVRLPASLRQLIAALMERERDRRPATAGEVLRRLDAAAAELGAARADAGAQGDDWSGSTLVASWSKSATEKAREPESSFVAARGSPVADAMVRAKGSSEGDRRPIASVSMSGVDVADGQMRKGGRRRWTVVTIAAVLGAIVGVASIFYPHPDEQEPPGLDPARATPGGPESEREATVGGGRVADTTWAVVTGTPAAPGPADGGAARDVAGRAATGVLVPLEDAPRPEKAMAAPDAVAPRDTVPEAIEIPDAASPLLFRVRSKPSGATVREGEEELGTTPLDLELTPGEAPRTFELRLRGYRTEEATLDAAELAERGATEKVVTLKKAAPKRPPRPRRGPEPRRPVPERDPLEHL